MRSICRKYSNTTIIIYNYIWDKITLLIPNETVKIRSQICSPSMIINKCRTLPGLLL